VHTQICRVKDLHGCACAYSYSSKETHCTIPYSVTLFLAEKIHTQTCETLV